MVMNMTQVVPQPERFQRCDLRTHSTILAALLLFTIASTPRALALQPSDQLSKSVIGADSTVLLVGKAHGSIVAAVVVNHPPSANDGKRKWLAQASGLCGVSGSARDARVTVRWYALLPQMRSVRVLPGPEGRSTDVTASSAALRPLQLDRRGQLAHLQDALVHSCVLLSLGASSRGDNTLRRSSPDGKQ